MAMKSKGRELKLGVTDWNLGPTDQGMYETNPKSLYLAKKLGFEGVQVSIGMDTTSGSLPLADETLQRRFLEASLETGVAIASLRLDILQRDGLGAEDPLEHERAEDWT